MRKSDPRYRDTEVPGLINDSLTMTNQLLDLCDYPIKDDNKTLNMQKQFPELFKLAPSRVIIPLQESLTADFPPTSSSEATHQPFPVDAPTFECLSALFYFPFFNPNFHSSLRRNRGYALSCEAEENYHPW